MQSVCSILALNVYFLNVVNEHVPISDAKHQIKKYWYKNRLHKILPEVLEQTG